MWFKAKDAAGAGWSNGCRLFDCTDTAFADDVAEQRRSRAGLCVPVGISYCMLAGLWMLTSVCTCTNVIWSVVMSWNWKTVP